MAHDSVMPVSLSGDGCPPTTPAIHTHPVPLPEALTCLRHIQLVRAGHEFSGVRSAHAGEPSGLRNGCGDPPSRRRLGRAEWPGRSGCLSAGCLVGLRPESVGSQLSLGEWIWGCPSGVGAREWTTSSNPSACTRPVWGAGPWIKGAAHSLAMPQALSSTWKGRSG